MIGTDYKIEAIDFLLEADCLAERYHPLIRHKENWIVGLKARGCDRKSDIAAIGDEELACLGGCTLETVRLFRRFLTLYDPKPQKFREIAKVTADPAEQAAFAELYHLPGVKSTRAKLYLLAGYATVGAIAAATEDGILARTAAVIEENGLSLTAPLSKEVRTHIAVAKAFCK